MRNNLSSQKSSLNNTLTTNKPKSLFFFRIHTTKPFPVLALFLTLFFLACGLPSVQNSDVPPTQIPQEPSTQPSELTQDTPQDVPAAYQFPEFYKGIYLNYTSGMSKEKLTFYIDKCLESGLNTIVIDVQPAKGNVCPIPESHVTMMIDKNIHPIARIVCFDQGLSSLPVAENKIESLYKIAESAAQRGFKEIQFDYIRFADQSHTTVHGVTTKLTAAQKYEFVESLLGGARERLRPYNVRTAADIFGRIPWLSASRHDVIGQKVENLDKVVDVICPMAYPSHYWIDPGTKKNWINTPYETVLTTATMAKKKVTNALIVSYIQAFEIKVQQTGLSYSEYVKKQIEAVHDSETSGYIMWNARQNYTVPFEIAKEYYKK